MIMNIRSSSNKGSGTSSSRRSGAGMSIHILTKCSYYRSGYGC